MTLDDGRIDLTGLEEDILWATVSVLESTAPDAAVLASTQELSFYEYQAGEEMERSWRTDEPVHLPVGTPLGEYPVSVSYRTVGGPVRHWTGGSYKHLLRTGVTALSYDREHIEMDDREVTVSGAVTTYNPSTRVRSAAGEGLKVEVFLVAKWARENHRVTAVTGPGGKFSITLTLNGPVVTGAARVLEAEPGVDLDERFPAPPLPALTFPYRITSQFSKTRVVPGEEVRVTGRVERLTDDGWKPYSGASVITSNSTPSSWQTPLGTSTVAADGSFSHQVKASERGMFTTTYVARSPFHTKWAYKSQSLYIPGRMAFQDTKITLDAFGQVKAAGRVQDTGRPDAGTCQSMDLALQHSTDGKSWRTLRSTRSEYGCAFSVTAAKVYNSAYYRVHHAEQDNFWANSSPAVRQSRNPTRFSDDTITPLRPAKNGTVTASGTLQRKTDDTWRSYAGGKVGLHFRPKGTTEWKRVAQGSANSRGGYTLKGKATGDGDWAVRTEVVSGHFFSETKVTYVDAR
ncbi:hypothetical protein ABT354_00340 [Streptomyces sp. NPDC000594]|uniref:hypothetical protein n=1 Tax=Streptomyces sp. NPDC000594 TaxID=3154261 RepID=UPI0033327EC2